MGKIKLIVHECFAGKQNPEALLYGNSYSKMQILGAAVKIYAKSPRLLVSAIKTIM